MTEFVRRLFAKAVGVSLYVEGPDCPTPRAAAARWRDAPGRGKT